MRNNTSDSKLPFIPTLQQKQILGEVRSLFREADVSEYILHLNELMGVGLAHVGDPDYIGKVAYSVCRINSFLVKLAEVRHYGYEAMREGGMTPSEVVNELI